MKTAGVLGSPGTGPRPSRHRRGTGLRWQLVSNALLAVTLPVLLTGGLAAFMLSHHLDSVTMATGSGQDTLARDGARTDAVALATEKAGRIDGILVARIAEARTWASSPAVLEAARAVAAAQPTQGLTGPSTEDPGDRPWVARIADSRRNAESFLRRQMAASPWLREIALTDRNGFDVAATGPARGISRSGERGWRGAWMDGISVAGIEYDGSAGLRSLDLSVRIEDPDGGTPLGVLRTVLWTHPLRQIAERAAPTIPDARVETASRSGVPAPADSGRTRIVNASADANNRTVLNMRASLGGERARFPLGGDSRTADKGIGESIASALDRLGLGEAVPRGIVSRIPDPVVLLTGVEEALVDWRVQLALAFGAIGVLGAAFASVLADAAARRYAAALGAMTDMAERSARGEPVRMAAIETPREIARLGDAVYRLGRLCTRVREPRPVGSAHAR